MINRNDKRELTGSVLVHVGIQQEGEYWRDCPPHAHFPLTCLFCYWSHSRSKPSWRWISHKVLQIKIDF